MTGQPSRTVHATSGSALSSSAVCCTAKGSDERTFRRRPTPSGRDPGTAVAGRRHDQCLLGAARRARGFRALIFRAPGSPTRRSGCPISASRASRCLRGRRRITRATDLPLLVDADTGWGAAFNISRTVERPNPLRRRGLPSRGPGAGQALRASSRQGSRHGRRDGRPHQGRGRRPHRPEFVLMARTDAHAVEGIRPRSSAPGVTSRPAPT